MSENFWAPLQKQVEEALKIDKVRAAPLSPEVQAAYVKLLEEGESQMSSLGKNPPQYNNAELGVVIPVEDAALHFQENKISNLFWNFFDRNTKPEYRSAVYQHAITPDSEVAEGYLAFGMFDSDPMVETKVVELKTVALAEEPIFMEHHWAFGLKWQGINKFRFDTPGHEVASDEYPFLHERSDMELFTQVVVHSKIDARIDYHRGPGLLQLFANMQVV